MENVLLGQHQTKVILQGEITDEPSATLYAYITNFAKLTPQRVTTVVNSGGRERHLIKDTFNAQKNNGIGLEHVFCANATASKNYYTMPAPLDFHGSFRAVSPQVQRGYSEPPENVNGYCCQASKLL